MKLLGGDNVQLTLLSAFSIRHSLEDTISLMGFKKSLSNYEVKEVHIQGQTDLEDYKDLFQFNRFITEELEERRLERSDYIWGSKITKTLKGGEEFNRKELLNVVGSVIKPEKLFAEIYETNKKQALIDSAKMWRG